MSMSRRLSKYKRVTFRVTGKKSKNVVSYHFEEAQQCDWGREWRTVTWRLASVKPYKPSLAVNQ